MPLYVGQPKGRTKGWPSVGGGGGCAPAPFFLAPLFFFPFDLCLLDTYACSILINSRVSPVGSRGRLRRASNMQPKHNLFPQQTRYSKVLLCGRNSMYLLPEPETRVPMRMHLRKLWYSAPTFRVVNTGMDSPAFWYLHETRLGAM